MINVTVQYKELDAALTRIERSSLEMRPLYAQIGEEILERIKHRFDTSTGPNGTRWKPLAQSTYLALADRLNKKQYHKSGQINRAGADKLMSKKILLGESRDLSRQFFVQADANGAMVATSVLYAAIHQFGGKTKPHLIAPKNKKALKFNGIVVKQVNHPGSTIPARPFFPFDVSGGIYPDEMVHIMNSINAYFTNAIEK